MNKYTVIGSGIAARSFAKWIDAPLKVFTKDPFPYSRMAILDVLKKEVKEENIALKFPKNAEIHTEKEASFIDADEKTIQFKDGTKESYEKLVIATGATPNKIDFKDASIPILTIRDLKDIKTIDQLLGQGKDKVCILGGGFVSMETANALYKRGVKITMLVSSSRVLSRSLNSEASKMVEQVLRQKGIKVLKNSKVVDIKDDTLYLEDGNTLKADFVVIGKGVKRKVIKVKWKGTVYEDYNADEYFKTPFEDIYLIGDALKTRDLITQEERLNAIWPIAEREGRHLAMLLNQKLQNPYKGDVPYNMLSVFDMYIFSIGNIKKGKEKINLKTDTSLFMITEENRKIYGLISINHPLPFARIVKRFMQNGYF